MGKKTEDFSKILAALDIKALNDMQQAAITANQQHQDVVLLSATGSGKTLAFLLPVLQQVPPDTKTTKAMIIVPSRELALQIEQVFRSMSTGLKITCCYGGHSRETEENNLVEPPAILVGTPGRISDHIRRENITTNTITTLVLDEFDKSLELGFQEEMSFIISALPHLQKKILTSATEAVEIPPFVGLQQPHYLNFLLAQQEQPAQLSIKTVLSPDKDKVDTLFRLLCLLGNQPAIIFCNHRESVERTGDLLAKLGIINTCYHGALEQDDRDTALTRFRNGSANVLVTTDLASRGLDIPDIQYIIHYHLPGSEEIFIHRNGRTARMQAAGTAIIILSPEEKLPAYITTAVEEIQLPDTYELPEKPAWSTVYLSAGKKNKVNKIDIVGFFSHKGLLTKEDIGLIEVKDFHTLVAVKKTMVSQLLQRTKGLKIKNQRVRIEVAR